MKTIGIFANCQKPSAPAVLKKVAALARKHGLKLAVCGEAARFIRGARPLAPKDLTGQIDMLMAFGGDGTMLSAVRLLDGRDIPVLGVNLGSLGFMTSVAQADVARAVACVAGDKFTTSRRAMVECSVVRKGKRVSTCRALNDLVIDRGSSLRIVTLNMAIDGEEVSSFACDGLIVSTPTGSTGHSLSAGGPILHPESSVFVISLVCPHTLSTRPLVVADSKAIAVTVARNAENLVLSVDGQIGIPLKTHDQIEIRRSAVHARFVHLADYSYFSVLRQKLNWRGSTNPAG
ncbi:MAG: NAD(+)/NADH kinase [Kiritimatiellia bacterium]